MLTLKDSSVIILDKIPQTLHQKTKDYLEKLKLGKPSNYTAAHFKKSLLMVILICDVDYNNRFCKIIIF